MDLKSLFFNPNEYELTNIKLGSGSYGSVYIVKNKKNAKKYAAKIIDDDNIEDGDDNQSKILNESINHSKLNHPSIVKFIGVSFKSLYDLGKFNPTIITEYISNGSLRNILDDERRSICDISWTPTKKYICLLGITDAMRYLHEKGFIHRDIKPENILMDENYYPKISDFGLSRCFSKFDSKSMTNQIGTPLYMAPELLNDGDDYGQEVDVYAFSMIAYEIVTGKKPFYDSKLSIFRLFQKVEDGLRPEFTENVTEKMKNLISQCWNHDPSKRPSFKEIFETLSTDLSYFHEGIEEYEVFYYLQDVLNYYNDHNRKCEEDENDDDNEGEDVKEKGKEEKEEEGNDENEDGKKDLSNNIIDSYFNIDQKQLHEIKYADVLFHLACEKGDKKMIKSLLSKEKVDINLTISHKSKDELYDIIETKTALHIAVENENISMIKLLLSDPKINVNSILQIKKKYKKFIETTKKTALHIACEKGNKEIISLLLSNPKIFINNFFTVFRKTNLVNAYALKKTALHIACERDEIEIVELLLSYDKIDVNSILFYFENHEDKKTALHVAVENQNIDIIQKIINHPKFKFNSDCGYLSVFDIAADKGNFDIILLLLKHKEIKISQNDRKIILNYLNSLNQQSQIINSLL